MHHIVKTFILSAAMLYGVCASAQTKPGSSDPRPFDVEFGVSKCADLSAKWGTEPRTNPKGGVIAIAPNDLYPGATLIAVGCPENGAASQLTLKGSKGGMGAPGAIKTYKNLAAKYKLVEGGPMPSLGDGFARFQAGKMVIAMSSMHLAFEYDVNYVTQEVWDAAKAAHAATKKAAQAKQDKL